MIDRLKICLLLFFCFSIKLLAEEVPLYWVDDDPYIQNRSTQIETTVIEKDSETTSKDLTNAEKDQQKSSVEIKKEDILFSLRQQLQDLFTDCDFMKLTISKVHLFRKIKIPKGNYFYEFPELGSIQKGSKDEILQFFSRSKRLEVQVLSQESGDAVADMSFMAYFELQYPVWIAQKNQKKGSLILQKNFSQEWKNIPNRNSIVGWDEEGIFANYQLKQNIREGEVLLHRHIHLPFVLKRGQIVRALYKDGGLEVSMKVKVLENGHQGETVGAEIIDTKKKISIRQHNKKNIEALF